MKKKFKYIIYFIIYLVLVFALAIFLVKTTKIDFYPKKSWF